MDREILFRGKLYNGEWVQGYYAKSGGTFILKDNGLTYGGFEMLEVLPKTVCQCTGLADKNGRKIFEGDVVKIPYEYMEDNICKVIFRHGMFIGELSDGCEDSMQKSKETEVIGNIFDNPELLEGGAE